jgi:hypothetical protein
LVSLTRTVRNSFYYCGLSREIAVHLAPGTGGYVAGLKQQTPLLVSLVVRLSDYRIQITAWHVHVRKMSTGLHLGLKVLEPNRH